MVMETGMEDHIGVVAMNGESCDGHDHDHYQ